MTSFEFGDIVYVAFPFTDQSSEKKRPAVVVSSESYNRVKSDLIIMALTSRIHVAPGLGEALVDDWREAGLPKPSMLKPVLATIEKDMVRKRLGRLSAADTATARGMLRTIIG